MYSTDDGASGAADFCALVGKRIGVNVEAVCADSHSHVFVKFAAQRLKLAVQLKRYLSTVLCQYRLDRVKFVIFVGKELCFYGVWQKRVDSVIFARSIRRS